MKNIFPRLNCGVLNDHYDIIGGGTAYSFKFLEYLKKYYDVDVIIPGLPKDKSWMSRFLNMDIEGLRFIPYKKGIGDKYPYMFLNISHWHAEHTNAYKRFMTVFFPQFKFPIHDYKLLAISQYTKKHILKRWKTKEDNIDIIYPPVTTDDFSRSYAKQKENIILHVSRITPARPEADKGHPQMIETFKQMVDEGLKDWEFHLVGQVQDQTYFQKLQQQAKDYPIFFHPSETFPALQNLYAKAKIYWHMTGISLAHEVGAQEHFGISIVEAMSSSCVPVSLNTGGPVEIIQNNKSGFLVKTLSDLNTQTTKLIKKPVLLNKMSMMACQRAKLFDTAKIERQLHETISHTNDVTIIMVTWNNSSYTTDCIHRLYEVTPPGFKLIIVDNDSRDGTRTALRDLKAQYGKQGHEIRLIMNKSNKGFAKANNQGLKYADTKYVCYLNNDTLPQWGWMERMIDTLDTHKKIGIVGARLYFPQESNGTWKVQHAGVKFTGRNPEHIGRFLEDSQVRGNGVEEVEAVTGACLMVRRALAKFDEGYVRGYYEDIDLCLRAREKDFKVAICHEAKLIHHEGASQIIAKKESPSSFSKIAKKNSDRFHKTWDSKREALPAILQGSIGTNTFVGRKIEIGGGTKPLYPSWVQIDLVRQDKSTKVGDARKLPISDNSLTNICSCYMLQCLGKEQARKALEEWLRCLLPAGKLELHVPNVELLGRHLMVSKDEKYIKEIFGDHTQITMGSRFGYTFETLDVLLTSCGYVRIKKISSPVTHPFSLSVEAFKYESPN